MSLDYVETDNITLRFEQLISSLTGDGTDIPLHYRFLDFAELHGLLVDPYQQSYSQFCRRVAAATVIRHIYKNHKLFRIPKPKLEAERLFAKYFSRKAVTFGMLNTKLGLHRIDMRWVDFRSLSQASGMVRVIATVGQAPELYGLTVGTGRARHFMSYDPYSEDTFGTHEFRVARGYSDNETKAAWSFWGCSAPFHAAVAHEDSAMVLDMHSQDYEYAVFFELFHRETGFRAWLGRTKYLQSLLDDILPGEVTADLWRFQIPNDIDAVPFDFPTLNERQVRILNAYRASGASVKPV